MKKAFISIFLIACTLLSVLCPVFAEDEFSAEEELEPVFAEEGASEEEAGPIYAEDELSEEEAPADPDASDEPAEEADDGLSPQEDSFAGEDDALPLVTDGSYKDSEKAIFNRIITSGMSEYEKLVAITKYAADNFSYGSYNSNNCAESLFTYGAGNCIANTWFILDLCKLAGIEAWYRPSGRDSGSSSTHVCAIAKINGTYYTADAGYSGSKPRSFDITERPRGFSLKDGVLYQYDGTGVTDLVIPAKSPTALIKTRSKSYTKDSMTITQIGYSGEQCFSYGGATGLRSITLPSTVKTVTATAFKGCKDLENIYVDSNNPYFTSIDGVLYSKDLTRLVCVPAKKTSVTIPSTVTKQDKDAFYGGKIPVTISSGSTPFKDVSNQWYADSVKFVYSHSLFKGTSSTTFSPNSTMTRGMFITVLGRFAGCSSALESWSGTLGVSAGSQIAVRDNTTTSGSTVLTRTSSAGEAIQVLSTVSSGKDGAVWYKVKYSGVTGYIRQKSTGSSGKTLLNVYTGAFTDLPSGMYYTGYAQWANIFHIMYGVSDTKFRPERDIKREDICVLLYRYLTDYLGKSLSTSGSAFADDDSISSYARNAVYAMRKIGIVTGYTDNTFRPRSYATRAEVATMFQRLSNYING